MAKTLTEAKKTPFQYSLNATTLAADAVMTKLLAQAQAKARHSGRGGGGGQPVPAGGRSSPPPSGKELPTGALCHGVLPLPAGDVRVLRADS